MLSQKGYRVVVSTAGQESGAAALDHAAVGPDPPPQPTKDPRTTAAARRGALIAIYREAQAAVTGRAAWENPRTSNSSTSDDPSSNHTLASI